MNDRTKNILIGVLIIGLVSMTVAYAALSQTLTIGGTAKVQNKLDSWNVHFAAVSSGAITTHGYAQVTGSPSTLTITSTQVTTPEVTLKAPGDYVEFKFDVKNEGDINAKLDTYTAITHGAITSTDNNDDLTTINNNIVITLTYVGGTAIKDKNASGGPDKLAHSTGVAHMLLTIKYKDTATTLPNGTVTIPNIAATMLYVQDSAS